MIRQERHGDSLRVIELEKIAKLKEIVALEDKLIKAEENYVEQSRRIHKEELEIIKLEGVMEESELEKERTSKQGLHYQSEYVMRAYKKIQRRILAKHFQVRIPMNFSIEYWYPTKS